MITDLNENNYLLFAIKSYDTPNCIMSEFEEDVKHITYIKRLFQKYRETKVIKERLVLNHIICLGNVFGIENTTKILFLKINKKDYSTLKTFLLYLNYMPDVVGSVNGSDIVSDEIPVDLHLAKLLRRI